MQFNVHYDRAHIIAVTVTLDINNDALNIKEIPTKLLVEEES
jgi:hypothetical protein